MCVFVYPRKIVYHLLKGKDCQRRTLWQRIVLTCNLFLFSLDEKVAHMTQEFFIKPSIIQILNFQSYQWYFGYNNKVSFRIFIYLIFGHAVQNILCFKFIGWIQECITFFYSNYPSEYGFLSPYKDEDIIYLNFIVEASRKVRRNYSIMFISWFDV